MNQRVVVGGFIVKDGKFLIAKRAANDTFLPLKWEIPGGKLEFNEEPEDGLKRELMEEAGIKVKVIATLSAWSYGEISKDLHYVQLDYLCVPEEGEVVKISSEHEDFKWITFDEIENYDISGKMKEEILKFRENPAVRELVTS